VNRNGKHCDYVTNASLAAAERFSNIAEEREHHEPNFTIYHGRIGGVARRRSHGSVRSIDLDRHAEHSRRFQHER
jgi:hypothetical protein